MSSRRSDKGNDRLPPTPRDREILKDVVRHRQMTREQIRRLHFVEDGRRASIQTACRRLKILIQRDYLTRIRLPAIEGSGPYVYHPGKAAVALLDQEGRRLLGRDGKGHRIRSIAGLSHALEVVDFYIAFKESLEDRGGKIISWLGESEVRYHFVHHGRRLLLSPDGYCLWALEEKEGSFFLEWDRGTENMSRFSQKLRRYEEYYRSLSYQDHLGEVGLRPRIIIVAPDQRRETKLIKWIARRLERGEFRCLPTILVASQDLVSRDVLGQIWLQPASKRRMRFVD